MDVAVSQVVKHLRRSVDMFFSIDPGLQKFGWAFLEGRELLCSGISPTSSISIFLKNIEQSRWEYLDDFILEGKLDTVKGKSVDKVVLGNGTGKDIFKSLLNEAFSCTALVDERNSTLEARSVYWELHPPKGWRKLIPISLQTPPRAVDDLAAYGIALKYLEYEEEKGN